MKGATILLLMVLVVLVSAQSGGPTLFPYPASIKFGTSNVTITPSSFSVSTTSSSKTLANAIARYKTLFFPFHELQNDSPNALSSLTITVASDSETLQFGVDESYSINIDGSATAQISAPSIYGAIRALETFSQLVTYDDVAQIYQIAYVPIVIQDRPRFPWRGLMIDSARHFQTKATILRALDAMAYSKFNVLHWHLVDAQSFPLVSTTYPTLAQKGAYAYPRAAYTPQDVAEVLLYAQQRGIRVVPEFDVPGHAASWGKAFNITATCPSYAHNINNIPLDPSNPLTFQILSAFLHEMASRFGDEYVHLGGDEVVFGCWSEDANVQKWAKANNLPSGSAIENYFENQLQKMVSQNNKTMVCWQELFNNGVTLNHGTIVEVWKDAPTAQQVISGGFPALIAYPYYLDKQTPNASSTHYEWVDTWQDFYNADPLYGLSGPNTNLVLGGEACMWAEQVDATNFDSRVWPRACGVAERLWSAKSQTNVTSAIPRLVAHRCRIAQRGVGAGPIAPDYCPLPDDSRFNRIL